MLNIFLLRLKTILFRRDRLKIGIINVYLYLFINIWYETRTVLRLSIKNVTPAYCTSKRSPSQLHFFNPQVRLEGRFFRVNCSIWEPVSPVRSTPVISIHCRHPTHDPCILSTHDNAITTSHNLQDHICNIVGDMSYYDVSRWTVSWAPTSPLHSVAYTRSCSFFLIFTIYEECRWFLLSRQSRTSHILSWVLICYLDNGLAVWNILNSG